MRKLIGTFVIFLSVAEFLSAAEDEVKSLKSDSLMAYGIELEDQKIILDSVLLDEELLDEDLPSDFVYAGDWDSITVNPYRILVDSMPDSFMVNCSGFYPPNQNVITSEFGPRWGRFHAGIDSRLKVGDSIHAAFDGKVRITRIGMRRKGYGYFVLIRHENGLETLYAHLSKVLVKPNQVVSAGDVIGLGGNTGRSTGPHLHFEVRFLGNPINPRNLIDFQNHVIYSDKYVISKKQSFKEYYAFLNSPVKYHRIKSGDTLGALARKYHTSVSKICRLNRLKSTSVLRIGKNIRVY